MTKEQAELLREYIVAEILFQIESRTDGPDGYRQSAYAEKLKAAEIWNAFLGRLREGS